VADMHTVIDAATNRREQEFQDSMQRWDDYVMGKDGPPALHQDYVAWYKTHVRPKRFPDNGSENSRG
jgi:hypothetical protein